MKLIALIILLSFYVNNQYIDTVIPAHLKNVTHFKDTLEKQLRILTVSNLMNQGWKLYAGYWYRLFQEELMWIPAENFCRELGAHLVSIRDLAENDFVHKLRKKNNVWIGLNKVKDTEGSYEWSDSSSVHYLNWDSSQPNEPEVDCVYMAYNQELKGTWFDYSCHSKLPQYFVCKLTLD